MIPSDHFVKMYNEIFKYLKKKGPDAVAKYFKTISEAQTEHCYEAFSSKGLRGMYEYWNNIIFEENCDADAVLDDGKSYTFIMHNCPSLGKVMDNDAGPCDIYCRHCPGWIFPLMTRTGFYAVYDLVGLDVPRCVLKVFAEKEDAEAYKKLALKRHPDNPDLIISNF